MNRTLLVLALLSSAAFPAAAQRADTLPLPRFTITPYLGGRIPFGTEQTFFTRDSTEGLFFDEERGGPDFRVRWPYAHADGPVTVEEHGTYSDPTADFHRVEYCWGYGLGEVIDAVSWLVGISAHHSPCAMPRVGTCGAVRLALGRTGLPPNHQTTR